MTDKPNKRIRKEETEHSESVLNSLEQLKLYTVVVSDTGEFETIKKFGPQDATTNPSLIYKATLLPEYKHLLIDAIKFAKSAASLPSEEMIGLILDKLAVNFGTEISKIVPGYISTEVDARLSFDTDATVARAHRIIDLYKDTGVDKTRVLIKIASTYEGIKAGKILEAEGIQCNLTLLFSIVQAAACAEANITLISPFVGRILDWHKVKTGKSYDPMEDPGVLSVKAIYEYYKRFGYKTIVMGASFRNTGEILALAGCDRLTIAPTLLEELKSMQVPVVRQLDGTKCTSSTHNKIDTNESSFRFQLNEDAMASEKLSEGIRLFVADIIKLQAIIEKTIQDEGF